MGLGMQLIAWPPAFVQRPGAMQGFRVVRFDNRDIGLSEHLDHLGVPNLIWESFKHRMGLQVKAPYSVQEMAADALGVLDALGIAQAHVVGVSMGGMIAQRVALAAPQRVSEPDQHHEFQRRASPARAPSRMCCRALLSRPNGRSEQAIVDHYIKLFKVIGSPAFPLDEAALRERILISTRRSFHPAGTVRQMAAVAADAGRADELARIKPRHPRLARQGRSAGAVRLRARHRAAHPGCPARRYRGHGHDLPPGVVERLLQPLVPHLMAKLDERPNNRSWASPRPMSTTTTRRCCFPISRLPKRVELGLHGAVPFFGADLWTRVRAELAHAARQAPGGDRARHGAVRNAEHRREQVVQALPQQLHQHAFRIGRRGARPHPRRRERGCLARRAQSVVGGRAHPDAGPVRSRAGAGARRPEPGPARHRVHAVHARARAADGRVRRTAGGGGADQQPAQEQLPGDRPAGLGQRADPLQRARRSTRAGCCATS